MATRSSGGGEVGMPLPGPEAARVNASASCAGTSRRELKSFTPQRQRNGRTLEPRNKEPHAKLAPKGEHPVNRRRETGREGYSLQRETMSTRDGRSRSGGGS